MNERDYNRKLCKALNDVPGCVCRLLKDGGRCDHKKPYDMYAIYRGMHISIEGKMPGEDLRPHQSDALDEDTAAGGKCFVVWYHATKEVYFVSWKMGNPDPFDTTWKTLDAEKLLDWMVSQ